MWMPGGSLYIEELERCIRAQEERTRTEFVTRTGDWRRPKSGARAGSVMRLVVGTECVF